MNIMSIIQRLRDEVSALQLAGGAAQLALAQGGLTAIPAAFVLPARDGSLESPFMDGYVQQQVSGEFAVVLAVRDLTDPQGAAAIDALEVVRRGVRDALLGWTPEGCDAGCEFAGGELVDFTPDAILWWNDSYRTTATIRSKTP